MADFSTVQTKFKHQYAIREKNVFYFKLCPPDVTGFILLSEKDPNIDFVHTSSLPVFYRFNICRTINSSPSK